MNIRIANIRIARLTQSRIHCQGYTWLLWLKSRGSLVEAVSNKAANQVPYLKQLYKPSVQSSSSLGNRYLCRWQNSALRAEWARVPDFSSLSRRPLLSASTLVFTRKPSDLSIVGLVYTWNVYCMYAYVFPMSRYILAPSTVSDVIRAIRRMVEPLQKWKKVQRR